MKTVQRRAFTAGGAALLMSCATPPASEPPVQHVGIANAPMLPREFRGPQGAGCAVTLSVMLVSMVAPRGGRCRQYKCRAHPGAS